MKRSIFKRIIIIATVTLFLAVQVTAFEEKTPTKFETQSQIPTWDGSVSTQFAGGSGTEDDPYLITTPAELAYLSHEVNNSHRDFYNEYFLLASDLDLSGLEWIPIGNYEYLGGENNLSPFCGNFDGNGYVISGLFSSSLNYRTGTMGLFGLTAGGRIENLGVTGAIESFGSGTPDAIGGLIAINLNTDVYRCFSDVDILFAQVRISHMLPTPTVGGLIGALGGQGDSLLDLSMLKADVSITESFSSGNITLVGSDAYGGGLLGSISFSYEYIDFSTTVSDCYATGDITRAYMAPDFDYSAVIEKLISQGRNASIRRSYYGGSYLNYHAPVGTTNIIFILEGNVSSLYEDCAINSTTVPNTVQYPGVTNLNFASMSGTAAVSNMSALDYDDIWIVSADGYYPQLRCFAENENPKIREISLTSAEAKSAVRERDSSVIGTINGLGYPPSYGLDMMFSLDSNYNAIILPTEEQLRYLCLFSKVKTQEQNSISNRFRTIAFTYNATEHWQLGQSRDWSTSVRFKPEWVNYVDGPLRFKTAQIKPFQYRELIKHVVVEASRDLFLSMKDYKGDFFFTLSDLTQYVNGFEIIIQGDPNSNSADDTSQGLTNATAYGLMRVAVDAGLTPSELVNTNPSTIALLCEMLEDGTARIIPFSTGHFGMFGGDSIMGTSKAIVFKPGVYAMKFVNPSSFSDTRGLWMEKSVSELTVRGVVNGVGKDLFEPNSPLTRAHFVTMLMRLLDYKLDTAVQFDNHESIPEWARNFAEQALELGIIGGSEFNSNEAITREEMFLILNNAIEIFEIPVTELNWYELEQLSEFADWNDVSPENTEIIERLINNGLIKGDGNQLRPQDGLTRAEGCQVLLNLIDRSLTEWYLDIMVS